MSNDTPKSNGTATAAKPVVRRGFRLIGTVTEIETLPLDDGKEMVFIYVLTGRSVEACWAFTDSLPQFPGEGENIDYPVKPTAKPLQSRGNGPSSAKLSVAVDTRALEAELGIPSTRNAKPALVGAAAS